METLFMNSKGQTEMKDLRIRSEEKPPPPPPRPIPEDPGWGQRGNQEPLIKGFPDKDTIPPLPPPPKKEN